MQNDCLYASLNDVLFSSTSNKKTLSQLQGKPQTNLPMHSEDKMLLKMLLLDKMTAKLKISSIFYFRAKLALPSWALRPHLRF